VRSDADVTRLLEAGNVHRAVAAHNLNDSSSRSCAPRRRRRRAPPACRPPARRRANGGPCAPQARDLHAAAGAAAQAERIRVARQPPLPALQAAPGGPGRRAPPRSPARGRGRSRGLAPYLCTRCVLFTGRAGRRTARPDSRLLPPGSRRCGGGRGLVARGARCARACAGRLRAAMQPCMGLHEPPLFTARRQRAREGDGHVRDAVQRGRADQPRPHGARQRHQRAQRGQPHARAVPGLQAHAPAAGVRRLPGPQAVHSAQPRPALLAGAAAAALCVRT